MQYKNIWATNEPRKLNLFTNKCQHNWVVTDFQKILVYFLAIAQNMCFKYVNIYFIKSELMATARTSGTHPGISISGDFILSFENIIMYTVHSTHA